MQRNIDEFFGLKGRAANLNQGRPQNNQQNNIPNNQPNGSQNNQQHNRQNNHRPNNNEATLRLPHHTHNL